LSIKPSTLPLSLPGAQLIEWGGALRWLSGADADAVIMRETAQAAGGHATLFRSGSEPSVDVFHPLTPQMMLIHRRLKEKFDPMGIFNPGRMYREL